MSDCIEWQGSYDTKGYGRVKIRGKSYKAHRLAYEKEHGPIPDGLFICHRCGNPACVNPEHLYAGTQKQNMRDRELHGRQPHGEASPRARLKNEDVIAIRARHAQGETYEQLGRDFKISDSHARNIVLKKQWAHL